jgi:general secretion pathway protein A
MPAGVSFRIRPRMRGPLSVEDFFGLRENPFSLTPNPRFLHRTRHAHETLGLLTRGILDRKGLILLSGEVGTGKTTLLYTALHLMDMNPAVQNKVGMAVIVHPTLTRDEFLEAVLDEFDVHCPSASRQRRLEVLLKMLLGVHRKGGVSVLVIDEAQLLTIDLLDEIRSLLNLQTSHEKLLQIVLCGQPEIQARLDGMYLRRDQPLVAVHCNTALLSLKDTHDYVQHRLRIAGARSDAIFMPEAVDSLHAHTNGIPRLINLLCAHALCIAAGLEAPRVSPRMIDEAAARICASALTPPPPSAPPRILPPHSGSGSGSGSGQADEELATPAPAVLDPAFAPPPQDLVPAPHAPHVGRRKRRAARRRAKLAQAAKFAQASARQIFRSKPTQNHPPGMNPFPGKQHPIARIAARMLAWNHWLNHWCSEHFTSKICGRPLFQLGLAGALFLTLAQFISASSPEQHAVRVAFGFLGMLFIDVSLGLGTYLLLLEHRLSPASRAGWAQAVVEWLTLRRRLG